jgi:hypothetical protein
MVAVALTGAVIPARASAIRPVRASVRTAARPAFGAGLKRASVVQTIRLRAEAAAGTSAGELYTLLSNFKLI